MQVFEDFYLFGFFDLANVPQSDYKTLLSMYRDIALLKSLYWRMFDHFRWLVSATAHSCQHTSLSDCLSKYGGFSDVQLLELVTDSEN